MFRLMYFIKDICRSHLIRSVYFSLVQSRANYDILYWGGTYNTNLNIQEKVMEHSRRLFKKTETFSLNIFILL